MGIVIDTYKVLTDAMKKWVYMKRQEKIAHEALKLIEQNFDYGKRLCKDRSELHER